MALISNREILMENRNTQYNTQVQQTNGNKGTNASTLHSRLRQQEVSGVFSVPSDTETSQGKKGGLKGCLCSDFMLMENTAAYFRDLTGGKKTC